MRVFITGATGNIGSAVLDELLQAGHTAVALARSDQSAATLAALGVDVVRGDLGELDLLSQTAATADGVIHLAFNHDFTAFDSAIAEEGVVLRALGEALAGSDRPLVIASGTPVVPGRVATEDDPAPLEGPGGGRGRNAQYVLDLASSGVRSAVVRLPRTVHKDAQGGFAGRLIATARISGIAGYPGEGTQRWPAVHSLDAARLFRLALEVAEPGTVLHAVADEGDAVRDIAEAIGSSLELPVGPVAAESFGPLGVVFGFDQPASSDLTRARFGWEPSQLGLIEDLRTNLKR